MKRFSIIALLIATATLLAISEQKKASAADPLDTTIKKLAPLHKKISPPGPSDWLAQHDEPGQTFAQYKKSHPVTPKGTRNTICIQPIGNFSETQQKILALTAEYMALYFSVPVETNKAIPLSAIPATAKRTHPEWGDKQILTTYVLHDLLQPQLPDNAAALIAFTSSDLWPGKGWNFVFGQASLRKRVGVWSIYRNGNPSAGEKSFRLCLRRTIKTAVHETSHMFSMLHCTAYECCMCGSNHREESDRRPLYLCPECMAKVCWATQADPDTRYERLLAFCERNKLTAEATFFKKSIRQLGK